MRNDKWKVTEELRPGSRRVVDAMRLVSEEMSDFDDDELPEVPPGVLTKGRPEGAGLFGRGARAEAIEHRLGQRGHHATFKSNAFGG